MDFNKPTLFLQIMYLLGRGYPSFRIYHSEGLNISICNSRMNNAAAVVRQPHSPGGVV
jgi:hypothetical protein